MVAAQMEAVVLPSVGGVLTDIRGLALLKSLPHKRTEAIIYSLNFFSLITFIGFTTSQALQRVF